jgi:hypothetical protein
LYQNKPTGNLNQNTHHHEQQNFMGKAKADRQTQAISVSLLRSFGAFGEDYTILPFLRNWHALMIEKTTKYWTIVI